MSLLPYQPRPGQGELVAAIEATQSSGGQLAVEAGTGTGKTVSALAASLASTVKDGRRIVYATRTNSQQAQVVREHAAITAAGHDAGLLVPLMGRKQYCPLLRDDARFREGTPEELGKLCRDAKEKATRQRETGRAIEGACGYYARLLEDGPGPVEALLGLGLDGGELARRVRQAGSCPYEALKMLLPKARAVAVPLVFVLDNRLRATLLQWMGVGPDECHLVLDEAHHVPDTAREHHSLRLSMSTLQRAQKEAEEYQDPTLAGTTLATTLLDALVRILHGLVDEHVRDEDGLVPPGALEEALLPALHAPTPAIERMARDLSQWGQAIRDDRRKKGRLPRSYLGAVGDFLLHWMAGRDEPTVQLVTGGDVPALEIYLLDPAGMLAWQEEFWSTLHMSGTLEPLAEHVALCGIPTATTKRFDSPFDPDHLNLWGLEGVHRRYEAIQRDPTIAERQQRAARELLAGLPGKSGLFFPSHRMLDEYLEEGFLHGVRRRIHVERPDMSSAELDELVRSFRRDPDSNAVLLAVLGGRLTEGIDYPGSDMVNLLIFGIPYPRPSARSQALIHHYDAKSGSGWSVAVHTPVARVLRQAIGRLIRGPDDRGTAVVLDERVVRFASQLPRLRMASSTAAVLRGEVAPDGYRTADQWPRKAPPGET